MTLICKCFSKCCSCCAQCFECVFEYCCLNWFSVACFGCCCFLFGMAVMLLIMYAYYSVAVYPTASVEPSITYQYEQEYPMYKREAGYNQGESYMEEHYYYDESGKYGNGEEYEVARNKRDNQTSTATPTTTSKSKDVKSSKSTNSTHGGSDKSDDSGNTSTPDPFSALKEPGEEELDFKLSNNFVNALHADAEQNRIKEPLGLCRNNEDIKTPEMNVTLFPLEQAQEVINCINGILKNQSKKHLCIELNEEMDAFLKWLILTGESKERRKQIKVTAYHDDFLFPSTCGTNMPYLEALTEVPVVMPQGSEIPVGPAQLGPPLATKSPAAPPDIPGVVETTCAPVNPGGKKGKNKG